MYKTRRGKKSAYAKKKAGLYRKYYKKNPHVYKVRKH